MKIQQPSECNCETCPGEAMPTGGGYGGMKCMCNCHKTTNKIVNSYLCVPTYQIQIYIAGELQQIQASLQEYVTVGCCVTVTPTKYVYTGGTETGAIIGLINYARFETPIVELNKHAFNIAEKLLKDCYQRSCSVVLPDKTYYMKNPQIVVER
jgi:hypothetical protein